jgi:hypothetical protein
MLTETSSSASNPPLSLTMTSEQAVDRVLTVGFAFKDQGEEGGDNEGQLVRIFLKKVGLGEGYPWCAAFVSFVGWWGCYDRATGKSTWPLKLTAGCKDMGADGKTKGILVSDPKPGDVFLIHYPSKKRFAHTGFLVAKTKDGSWTTIEGNTNTDGSRNGWKVCVRTRKFKDADRFLRWADKL